MAKLAGPGVADAGYFGFASATGGDRADLGVSAGADLAEPIATRNRTFASQFARRCKNAEAAVDASADAMRWRVLNSVIMADADAQSEIPALDRALTATRDAATRAMEVHADRAAQIPALRVRLLEACAEKKLLMERKYLAEDGPAESRMASEVKAIMDGKSKRRG